MSDLPIFETMQGDAIKALESEVERLRSELAELKILKHENTTLRCMISSNSEEIAELKQERDRLRDRVARFDLLAKAQLGAHRMCAVDYAAMRELEMLVEEA